MRCSLVLRLCLMLVLAFNGLVAAHAGGHASPSAPGATTAGHADMTGPEGGGCHEQPPAAEAATPPSAPDTPASHLACCSDLCQCACLVPVLSSLLPAPPAPWSPVAKVHFAGHYASLSPIVLLRPPIA